MQLLYAEYNNFSVGCCDRRLLWTDASQTALIFICSTWCRSTSPSNHPSLPYLVSPSLTSPSLLLSVFSRCPYCPYPAGASSAVPGAEALRRLTIHTLPYPCLLSSSLASFSLVRCIRTLSSLYPAGASSAVPGAGQPRQPAGRPRHPPAEVLHHHGGEHSRYARTQESEGEGKAGRGTNEVNCLNH